MAKFILTFRGGQGFRSDPEEQAQVMAAWGAWYGTLGQATVDPGAPFGASGSVSSEGSSGPEEPLGGYVIVQADSLDDAKGLATGNPVIGEGGSVDVYELVEM